MSPGTLLLRADANIAIGTGHIMRCLALAQAWRDSGGKTVMAVTEVPPAIQEKLCRESVEIAKLDAKPGTPEDAAGTARLAREQHAAWVVLDGYCFDSSYQQGVKSSGVHLLVIDDDLHADCYSADLLLNQNPHAAAHLYAGRAPQARLLLGSRYAMLRRQFAAWGDWRRGIPALGRRLLVTMGGSDPDDFSQRVIDALETIKDEALEVVIVVGGSNPHRAGLENAVAKLRHHARLVKNADNMPELMAWADVAISGAGITCWEMCLLSLPMLVVDLAPNQLPVARRLNELGVARHIGSSHDCPPDRIASELSWLLRAEEVRQRMSEAGRKLVDGRGASRVCAAMMRCDVRLRRAQESDSRLLWEWVNEPGVRASSFSQRQIGWEKHARWFHNKLADSRCVILIGEDTEGRAIGQVRFDQQTNEEAEIDVSVAPDFRGTGYGSMFIDMAVREFFRSTNTRTVNAFIRPENLSSVRAFQKAGFEMVGEKAVRGNRALHYCRKLEESSKTTS